MPKSEDNPPRVRPALQARSREQTQRILSAGLALLRTHSFHELTMEQIAQAAGCSVGTLYKRFANKDALLDELADTVRRDILSGLRTDVTPGGFGGDSLEDVVCRVVGLVVETARTHEGLTRALQTRNVQKPRMKRPLRDANLAAAAMAVAAAKVHRPDHLDEEEFERRFRIGYQMMIGTIVNMIINDPGPLHLTDEQAVKRLAGVMVAYLLAP